MRRQFVLEIVLLPQPPQRGLGLLERRLGSDARTAPAAALGMLPLNSIFFHDLLGIEIIHFLEGIDGDQNGSRARVNNVGVVSQPQGVQNRRLVKMSQPDQIVNSAHHGGIDFGRRGGDDGGFGILARELIRRREVAQFDVRVVGGLEGGGIDGDLGGEGLDVVEIIVAVDVVVASGHGGRRETVVEVIIAVAVIVAFVAATAAVVITAIVSQGQLDHGFIDGAAVLIVGFHGDIFAVADDGRDPPPLRGRRAQPDVGAYFHCLGIISKIELVQGMFTGDQVENLEIQILNSSWQKYNRVFSGR
mmetsp:Transcript_26935/g.54450  ORF Transcript_26935/g.54450 Transcript_26935/m.54450 type:complete len:304 (+) Transcript_26935:5530-6441(+)